MSCVINLLQLRNISHAQDVEALRMMLTKLCFSKEGNSSLVTATKRLEVRSCASLLHLRRLRAQNPVDLVKLKQVQDLLLGTPPPATRKSMTRGERGASRKKSWSSQTLMAC